MRHVGAGVQARAHTRRLSCPSLRLGRSLRVCFERISPAYRVSDCSLSSPRVASTESVLCPRVGAAGNLRASECVPVWAPLWYYNYNY